MNPETREFVSAVRSLHKAKDAAYRDAWKRRGEVVSIVANIARKVDRIDYAGIGAPSTLDEHLIDTAVDLLVYSIKYKTFLADADQNVAISMYAGSVPGPYSDGLAGFDHALERVDFAELDNAYQLADASRGVVAAFDSLLACFSGVTPTNSVVARSQCTSQLASSTVRLIAAARRVNPQQFTAFLKNSRIES